VDAFSGHTGGIAAVVVTVIAVAAAATIRQSGTGD